ncbi:MAG: urease accessory protein UreH domain-containing protein [Planctomycetota bacterium]|jgi:ABC-type nickel/cobalt efflux system permease component RcnA
MDNSIIILCGTAASIGLIHTALGPDHYLPFIMMSYSSFFHHAHGRDLIDEYAGVLLGIQVMKLEVLEAFRGSIAAWLLIGFGFAYFLWGIRRAILNRPHRHVHSHGDAGKHEHEHTHLSDHAHVHDEKKTNMTPWILFTIFVFGPCEPLIPLLMYPAAEKSVLGTILVAAVFSVVTVGTMLTIVLLSSWGVAFVKLGRMERYTHAVAGATICASGLAIQFLGL